MTKQKFLDNLKKQTNDDQLVAYYDELISDRIESGEDEKTVMASYDLNRVLREHEYKAMETKLVEVSKSNKRWKIWVVILALFSTPVTIPLGIAFLAVVFSLAITALSLFAAGVLGGIALIGGGIQMIINGDSAAFVVLNMSAGLVVLGIMGIIGAIFTRLIIRFIRWMCVKLFGRTQKRQIQEVRVNESI
ncbi:MAG: DUF1700 domain-containing protein [Firmicutes bacterium]|nr:DUF1700 domain-containing protein [Bacillota bacterium]